jgi:hypothetical protein
MTKTEKPAYSRVARNTTNYSLDLNTDHFLFCAYVLEYKYIKVQILIIVFGIHILSQVELLSTLTN